MAATVVNGPGTPVVTRGKAANLGTLSVANQAVQFAVPQLVGSPNGFDAIVIATTGNLVIPASSTFLEGSIDGGTTWFLLASPPSPNTSSLATVSVGTGLGDTQASTVQTFSIAGLSGLCLFRFGFSAITSGSGSVWVAIA